VPVISDTTFLLPLSLSPRSKTLRPLGPCVQPIGGRSRWPRRAKELTRLFLERRAGWIILGSIRDEAAIIALELKRESMDEMSSLTDLLVGMGCAQYTDNKIAAAIPGILN